MGRLAKIDLGALGAAITLPSSLATEINDETHEIAIEYRKNNVMIILLLITLLVLMPVTAALVFSAVLRAPLDHSWS